MTFEYFKCYKSYYFWPSIQFISQLSLEFGNTFKLHLLKVLLRDKSSDLMKFPKFNRKGMKTKS